MTGFRAELGRFPGQVARLAWNIIVGKISTAKESPYCLYGFVIMFPNGPYENAVRNDGI